MTKTHIPHLEHLARDKALKKMQSKEHIYLDKNVRSYVEFLPGNIIQDLGPHDLQRDMAALYPAANAGIKAWTEYQSYVTHTFDQKVMNEWVKRIIDHAISEFEKHGPMQKGIEL